MTWTAESVLRQIEVGEDSRVEFKEAFFKKDRVGVPSREIVADQLAAFGTSTGGTLMFSGSTARRRDTPDMSSGTSRCG